MDTIKRYTLLASFLLVPFAVLSTGLIHLSHTYALTVAALIILTAQNCKPVVIIQSVKRKNKTWANLTLNNVIFLFVCYASIWQIVLFLQALSYKIPPASALDGLSSIIFLIIAVVIYKSVERSEISLTAFFNIICISALLQLFLAYSQLAFGSDPFNYIIRSLFKTESRLSLHAPTGTLGNNNYLAAYLVIALPFFCRGFNLRFYTVKRPWLGQIKIPYSSSIGWWCAIPLILIMLYATQTSTAVIALGAGIYVYWTRLLKEKRITWKVYAASLVAMSLIILVYVFYYHSIIRDIGRTGYDLDRYDMWIYVWRALTSSPWFFVFGFGPGALWIRPYPLHSEWVTMIYQYGMTGLCLMGLFIAKIPRTSIYLFPAAVIIFVNMLGNSALHYAPSAFLILIILGLLERESTPIASSRARGAKSTTTR